MLEAFRLLPVTKGTDSTELMLINTTFQRVLEKFTSSEALSMSRIIEMGRRMMIIDRTVKTRRDHVHVSLWR